LLRDFYSERLALLQRHVTSARGVSNYDVNNAYQHVIAREETHVYCAPRHSRRRRHRAGGVGDAGASGSERDLASADAAATQAFVAKWTPKVAEVTHARHRKMLQVVLGEMQEHQRLFQQAGEGRTDIIGVPLAGTERHGVVLGTRWVE
jgi:hypothetical protein